MLNSFAGEKKEAIRPWLPERRKSSGSYTRTHHHAFTASEGVHKAIVGGAGLCSRMGMKGLLDQVDVAGSGFVGLCLVRGYLVAKRSMHGRRRVSIRTHARIPEQGRSAPYATDATAPIDQADSKRAGSLSRYSSVRTQTESHVGRNAKLGIHSLARLNADKLQARAKRTTNTVYLLSLLLCYSISIARHT